MGRGGGGGGREEGMGREGGICVIGFRGWTPLNTYLVSPELFMHSALAMKLWLKESRVCTSTVRQSAQCRVSAQL